MEGKDKFRIALTIACFAAISLVLTNKYRKYRKRKQSANNSSCYLKTESKPQHKFQRVLADNSYAPFKHLKLSESISDDSSNLNPYEAEIMELIKNPRIEFEFGNVDTDMEMSGSYVWVETEAKLRELAEALSKEKVFGVDTEQHGLRSFLGFTALVQISMGSEDYLVDTIALHDVMGILRPVFANPEICKVFHGADNDVVWLQRDFHIYVVNLFDTAKACDILLKPQKSLAYLLETYCGVATNKLLQREDWRQRPLPAEMVQYARMDAHYLLYIADCLTSELKNQENDNLACVDEKFHFVHEASRRSNAICLQAFSKEIEASPGESAASSIISRRLNDHGSTAPIFSNSKFQDLVRRICCWRDLMARVHDESLRYVLSDYAVAALAEKVPKTEDEIYDTISQADLDVDSMNPTSSLQSPSSIVWSHYEDLYDLFQDKIGKLDDFFELILTKHLGPNGTCTLSLYNYALLSKRNLQVVNRSISKENGFKVAKKVARKASRELFVQKFSCKAPVYHNCRIYANDGRLLCYCDQKKLEWYLSRDLAKIVDEKPPAIMLLFEPKGRPEDEGNDFYIQSKKNICVGCGEGNHYLRYRIIPSCYRMHFPEHLKSHRSHDIVLVCVDCHEKAHAAAEKYKKQIAAEYGIPLFIRRVVDSTHTEDISGSTTSGMNAEDAGVSPLELRTAAMALLRHGPRMPHKRHDELTQIVIKYYGGREISAEDLERALLVGMSPHERRRVEKKRGISLSRSTRSIISGKEPENNNVVVLPSESALRDSSHIIKEEIQIQEDRKIMVTNTNLNSPSLRSDIVVREEDLVTDINGGKTDENVVSEAKNDSISDSDADSFSRNSSNGITGSVQTGPTPANHHSKLSLLGHGPHGKQVVDYLLKDYGEDGVRQFCQRWRQVFVEAIHPRFLPGGWDVTHSGRREFGPFSVYNPANKAPSAANGVGSNEATENTDRGSS